MSLDQIAVNECFKCRHPVEAHKDGFCNGSIDCMCPQFILPALANLMAIIQEVKDKYKTLRERCKYMLEHIPPLRNAGQKSFHKAYLWVWHDFKITNKNPPKLDLATWKTLPDFEDIGRAKRFVKQHNQDLRTYDPVTKLHQSGVYQALLEMAMDGRDDE